ncbi:hypothetical protein GTQ99_00410 [Kineococcus sp. T13]|uniref:hypothetical protein n=1 Tax=Kineococcus vitellinus TaxID=2696565 RepID=UPI00141328F0|nr:hypothetical protein [Kineococcus vitellinus]NAZ73893.1 hypothetical protein [Kineococcus vitellinus]
MSSSSVASLLKRTEAEIIDSVDDDLTIVAAVEKACRPWQRPQGRDATRVLTLLASTAMPQLAEAMRRWRELDPRNVLMAWEAEVVGSMFEARLSLVNGAINTEKAHAREEGPAL